MYRSHYGLIQKPFQLNTDPSFFWLGEKHKEALATLKYGVIDQKGFLLVSGDVGTGKTTLINALLESLDRNNILVATVRDPAMNLIEFYNFIARSFQMPGTFTTKMDFLVAFSDFLNRAYEDNKTVLLIIDEAHSLSGEVLEHIRLLSNIERPDEKLINIFFVGQNEIHDTLALPECRALRQRISLVYHIDPLSEKETAAYIAYRLNVAGARQIIFTQAAVREVHHVSMGYPRMINTLCDHALLTGYTRETTIITPAIIIECARQFIVLNNGVNEGAPPETHPRQPYGITRPPPATVLSEPAAPPLPKPSRSGRTMHPAENAHHPMIFNKHRLWLTAACLALVIPTVFLVYRMLNSPTLAPTAPAPQTAQSTPASPVEPKTPAPETTSPPAVNRHDTLMVQAKNALENKEFNRSIALYQQIVKRNAADLPNIRADYSNALHSQADKIADERPDQARQLLTSAVDINPRNARAYFDLGHLWTQSQNHLKATQAYRASADLGYRPPETFYNLGYNYAALREYALAEQMFRHAVTLNPPYLDKALYNLAVVQHKQGKKQLCIENLEKALNHNPDNLKAKGYLKRLLTYKDTTWINVANSTP